MAKATGIASQARGKVGNVIYYLSKNRAGKLEQTVKSYQPVVANPQSYAQALARVPVGPVQRICSALLPIIQRGFEGTSYGEPSKSEFLSYNLKYFRGPFMPKGTVSVPPGIMMVSKGSLRSINVLDFSDENEECWVQYGLQVEVYAQFTTRGQLAQALLNGNTWLSAGEQLTFVWCMKDEDVWNWRYWSLILDVNDSRPFPSFIDYITQNDGYLQIYLDESAGGSWISAACVVRSQPYGESSFKRSTALLQLNPAEYLYNDDAAVQAAVASYRTGEDPEDWEDDPTPEYQQLAYLCMVQLTQDMIINTDLPTLTTIKCLGYVTKGGEMGIFYKYSSYWSANVLLDSQADILTYTYNGQQRAFKYKATYQPAREYSTIYGHM